MKNIDDGRDSAAEFDFPSRRGCKGKVQMASRGLCLYVAVVTVQYTW